MRLPPVVVLVSALGVSALACSSVPDVAYVDLDAAPADDTDDGGVSSGGVPGTPYRCPDNPPPPSRGTCCGTRLCLRCSPAHCSRCERAICGDAEVCCGRGQFGGSFDCRRASACN